MFRFLAWLFLASPVLFCSSLCSGVLSTADYLKGSKLSQDFQLPTLLVFTGSDWCEMSKKFHESVLEEGSQASDLSRKMVVVTIDFPEINRQSVEVLQQNKELREKYHIDTFPSFVLLDPAGVEISRFTYDGCDLQTFTSKVRKAHFTYCELDQFLQSPQTLVDLEKAYLRAQELHCSHLQEKIINRGLDRTEGAFFPLERYLSFVREGAQESEEALEVRRLVMMRDPENREGALLRLALIDLQAREDVSEEEMRAQLSTYMAEEKIVDQRSLERLHEIIIDAFTEKKVEESHETLAQEGV